MAFVESLYIGTFGWRHDDWRGSFYPDDLPEEWQFDYFSNAFRVVLVPQEEWLTWSDETLCELQESIETPFYMYLELKEAGLPNHFFEHACEVMPLDVCAELEQLKRVLSVLASSVAGLVVWSELEFTQRLLLDKPVTLVSRQYALPGWLWKKGGVCFSGHPLGVVFQLSSDGKEQVALLNDFMDSLSGVKAGTVSHVPFIVGGKINMQQVANLKTVGELLGY